MLLNLTIIKCTDESRHFPITKYLQTFHKYIFQVLHPVITFDHIKYYACKYHMKLNRIISITISNGVNLYRIHYDGNSPLIMQFCFIEFLSCDLKF